MASNRNAAARILALTLIGLVLVGVCMDPYTFSHDASDLVVPGPWWQLMLGVTDVLLLAAALGATWRRRHGGAFALLVVETLWAVGSVLILVGRDGEARFRMGFGARPYLAEYVVVMALRLAALGCLWIAARRAARAGS